MKVIKKDLSKQEFSTDKIVKALEQTNARLENKATVGELEEIALIVKQQLIAQLVKEIHVKQIHETVLRVLEQKNIQLYREYKNYRDYKTKYSKVLTNLFRDTSRIIWGEDKENANKDSTLISTKKILLADALGELLAKEFELPPIFRKAMEDGHVYKHDLRDEIMGSINCCLFDVGHLLENGFELNGVQYRTPTGITSAGHILSDIVLSASSQQFGGFTIPEIDSILAPYAEKTYQKEKEHYRSLGRPDYRELAEERTNKKLYQVIEAIEHRLNTINNALAQTPFVTFTFGMDTSRWGRQVSKAILENRLKGLGKQHITAIFPKLVFLHHQETNGLPHTQNYDIKQLAVKCSSKRNYPDWLSLDEGYVADMYREHGEIVSPMGCRAYLSPWYNEHNEVVFTGRANCGAISLNIPRFAIESKGDNKKFWDILEHYFWISIDEHLRKFEKLKKVKASTNPLFFVEGGCHMQLDPEDTIEEAIRTFTWSIGYIGLEEATYFMRGKHLHEDSEFANEVLAKLNHLINLAKQKYGLLFALYATPAEGLCYRWATQDQEEFGTIAGVTDKSYYTNSFHVDVRAHISFDRKQEIEAELFHQSNGGHISYNEFPRTDNLKAFEQAINLAMMNGLYYGINMELDMCMDCGYEGEISGDCPNCGGNRVFRINRVCGYLGYHTINGDTRYNNGKLEEVENRVDHF